MGIFSYFKSESNASGKMNANRLSTSSIPTKKREIEKDTHFCIYIDCHKTISRGNKAAKIRHEFQAQKRQILRP